MLLLEWNGYPLEYSRQCNSKDKGAWWAIVLGVAMTEELTLSLFNILSRFVITVLPRSKHLLISWLQSPSAVISDLHAEEQLSMCTTAVEPVL